MVLVEDQYLLEGVADGAGGGGCGDDVHVGLAAGGGADSEGDGAVTAPVSEGEGVGPGYVASDLSCGEVGANEFGTVAAVGCGGAVCDEAVEGAFGGFVVGGGLGCDEGGHFLAS